MSSSANTVGRLGPGLDTRGAGGHVVPPPSVGHNGRPYEWIVGDELADPPTWLVESLKPQPRTARERADVRWSLDPTPYGLAALTRELVNVAIAAVGTRNSRLF